ncbi:MAG TPA: hypothetical protein P5137_11960 [Candidatus Brocadiia bacterium]|nr:hypothetical protein [Candidatus Brocadiia bacterium]
MADWAEEIGGVAPAVVTFDFRSQRRFRRVRAFYSGELPPLTIEASADGNAWAPVATSADKRVTGEKEVAVRDWEITADQPCRFLRLRLEARAQPLLLAEVEVWGP